MHGDVTTKASVDLIAIFIKILKADLRKSEKGYTALGG